DQVSTFGSGVGLKDMPETPQAQDILSPQKQAPADMWQMPVIVAVDEARRLPSGHDTSQSLFLQAVH
ncbi:MAG: hypothetical protein OXE84_08865, partial [Rhodobacteraceae bacterium]|nr:hypothetical protein [Paracoccaceae bacterium]